MRSKFIETPFRSTEVGVFPVASTATERMTRFWIEAGTLKLPLFIVLQAPSPIKNPETRYCGAPQIGVELGLGVAVELKLGLRVVLGEEVQVGLHVGERLGVGLHEKVAEIV